METIEAFKARVSERIGIPFENLIEGCPDDLIGGHILCRSGSLYVAALGVPDTVGGQEIYATFRRIDTTRTEDSKIEYKRTVPGSGTKVHFRAKKGEPVFFLAGTVSSFKTLRSFLLLVIPVIHNARITGFITRQDYTRCRTMTRLLLRRCNMELILDNQGDLIEWTGSRRTWSRVLKQRTACLSRSIGFSTTGW